MKRVYLHAAALGAVIGYVTALVAEQPPGPGQPRPHGQSTTARASMALVVSTDTSISASPSGLSIRNPLGGVVELFVSAGRLGCSENLDGSVRAVDGLVTPADHASWMNQWNVDLNTNDPWTDLNGDGRVLPDDVALHTNAWDAAVRAGCPSTLAFVRGLTQVAPAVPASCPKGTVLLACWRGSSDLSTTTNYDGIVPEYYYLLAKVAPDGELILSWTSPAEIKLVSLVGSTLAARRLDLRFPADYGRSEPTWLSGGYRPWTLSGQ